MAKQSQPMATKKTVGGKHAKNVVGGGLPLAWWHASWP